MLTEPQNERIRRVIRQKLIPKVGSQNQAAAALGMSNGSLSRFMADGCGTTLAVARRLAKATGADLGELLGVGELPPDEEGPELLSQRREWAKVLAQVSKAYPHVPPHVWRFVGESSAPHAPAPLTPHFVYFLALAHLEP